MNHWEPQHLQFYHFTVGFATPASCVTEKTKLFHIDFIMHTMYHICIIMFSYLLLSAILKSQIFPKRISNIYFCLSIIMIPHQMSGVIVVNDISNCTITDYGRNTSLIFSSISALYLHLGVMGACM